MRIRSGTPAAKEVEKDNGKEEGRRKRRKRKWEDKEGREGG